MVARLKVVEENWKMDLGNGKSKKGITWEAKLCQVGGQNKCMRTQDM